jgi:hypothetical protein
MQQQTKWLYGGAVISRAASMVVRACHHICSKDWETSAELFVDNYFVPEGEDPPGCAPRTIASDGG